MNFTILPTSNVFPFRQDDAVYHIQMGYAEEMRVMI
jgi:hypothetical protein